MIAPSDSSKFEIIEEKRKIPVFPDISKELCKNLGIVKARNEKYLDLCCEILNSRRKCFTKKEVTMLYYAMKE